MNSRTFPFAGPPIFGLPVRLFMAVALGPVCGIVLSGLAVGLVKLVTGDESPAAMAVGGLLGWGAFAALVLSRGGKPTPGVVVIDDQKIIRSWRGLHQEMNVADIARIELVPEQWVLLTDRDGKVLVVSAPGADLALIDQELRARQRRDRR